MKKLFVILALGTFAACNSGESSSTTDSTATTVDTTTHMSTTDTTTKMAPTDTTATSVGDTTKAK